MQKEREKLGKIVYDQWGKKPEASDATEQMREQLSEYDQNMFDCIGDAKNKYPTDFYVTVITKKERLMPNVMRNYFFARHSCPTPDYDQTVYLYTRTDDSIEFLWVIPSKQTCLYMVTNPLEIQERELLQFVLDFADGTLMKKSMILNKEIEE